MSRLHRRSTNSMRGIMAERITLVVVDDHPVFRAGLKQVLSEQSDMEILAEASDGEEALGLIRMLKPDVVLLDVDMPVMNGIEAAETMHREELPAAVIMLTVYDDEELLNHAMEHGVLGYVLKDSAVTEIARAIRTVHAGKYYLSPSLEDPPRHPYPDMPRRPVPPAGFEELTPAEQRVLQGVSQNRTSREIAAELFISTRTVDHHRASICRKLGLSGQYALLRFALDNKQAIGKHQ